MVGLALMRQVWRLLANKNHLYRREKCLHPPTDGPPTPSFISQLPHIIGTVVTYEVNMNGPQHPFPPMRRAFLHKAYTAWEPYTPAISLLLATLPSSPLAVPDIPYSTAPLPIDLHSTTLLCTYSLALCSIADPCLPGPMFASTPA